MGGPEASSPTPARLSPTFHTVWTGFTTVAPGLSVQNRTNLPDTLILGGPVKKALQRSPQARRHFTRLDQLGPLAGASESNSGLGFMARLRALCVLPRTHAGNRCRFEGGVRGCVTRSVSIMS